MTALAVAQAALLIAQSRAVELELENDAIRAALDAAEADKRQAVLDERERCVVAARVALAARKEMYKMKAARAYYNNDLDRGSLMDDLAMSQDYALDEVESAIQEGEHV